MATMTSTTQSPRDALIKAMAAIKRNFGVDAGDYVTFLMDHGPALLAALDAQTWRPISEHDGSDAPVDLWIADEFPRRVANCQFREPTDGEYWVSGSDEPQPSEQTIGLERRWFDLFGPIFEAPITHFIPLPPHPRTKTDD